MTNDLQGENPKDVIITARVPTVYFLLGPISNDHESSFIRCYMASKFILLHRAVTSTHSSITTRSFNPAFVALARPNRFQSHNQARTMAQKDVSTYTANGENGDMGSTEGELNEWKHRAPYKIHDNDPNFSVRYEGSCHCGKVQYQLSREKPLDAKYCHCTTCQKIHGESKSAMLSGTHLMYSRMP